MKKTSKVLAFLLSMGMLIGSFASCGGGTNAVESSTGNSSSITSVETEDVYTSYTPKKLISNGVDIGNYSIVVKEGAFESTTYAATELQAYIKAATGKTLPIKTDSTQASECEIVLGNTNRTSDIDISKLGTEGFTLKAVGKQLFIAADDNNAKDSRGVIYGVYTYLEKLGYRFYATGVEKIPEAEDVYVTSEINETQIPVFDYREVTYGATLYAENSNWAIKQKINSYFTRGFTDKVGGSAGFACGSGDSSGLVHTSFRLVSEDLVEEHPEYFALDAETGERMAGEWKGQICYTNEGVYQHYKNGVRGWLQMHPNSEYMSISINDNWHMCECDNCKASDAQYGTSGTVLKFTNRMATELKEEGYDQKFVFLAYWATAPVPKGGVVPADNVVVQLAIDACQAHGFEEDCTIGNTFGSDNAMNSLQAWGEISNSLMVYGYVSCYNNRIMPVPNYKAILQSFHYYAEKTKVEGHFSDAIGEPVSGEFGELKGYIISKLQWNPLMSEEEMWYHVRDFLNGYYGESAGEILYEYVQLTVEQVGDKCWENNLGNLTDKDIFFADGTPVEEKLDFVKEADELWEEALEWADNQTYVERVERAQIQFIYYKLKWIARGHIVIDPTMEDYYANLQEQLETTMFKYGVTN